MKLFIALIRDKRNKQIEGFIGPFNSSSTSAAVDKLHSIDVRQIKNNKYIEIINLNNSSKVAELFL